MGIKREKDDACSIITAQQRVEEPKDRRAGEVFMTKKKSTVCCICKIKLGKVFWEIMAGAGRRKRYCNRCWSEKK